MTAHDFSGEDWLVPDDLRRTTSGTSGRPPETLFARVGRDTAYLLPSLPLSTAAFTVVLTLVVAGGGLSLVWIGLPVLVAGLATARAFASAERLRLHRLTGRPIPSGLYDAAPPGASGVRRLLWPLRRPQYWLDAAWALVGFVTSLIAWVITVSWYAAIAGGLTYWLWQWSLPQGGTTLADLLGFRGPWGEMWLNLILGLLCLLSLPWVLRGAAWLHAAPAELLLNGRAALREEVEVERRARQAHQDAEARSLRRFERDIHDGPQQRLVRLGMDLGRAKKQIRTDPDLAEATVDAALRQARETVEELRSLTRGIAPPLLVDRGLEVALDELVARADIPVSLEYDVAAPLSPAVETAAYFTVSEALTNIAKHSLATRAEVSVVAGTGWVEVGVHDNGMGGAHEAKGTGLRGLRSRVEGVGGVLDVDSPAGGPTTLTASLPLR